LQKFKRFKEQNLAKMGDGYDQVGKKNMMKENRLKKQKYEEEKVAQRIRRGHDAEDEAEAKMDEYTHII
jgi:cell division septum initiation protein DivIVA